MIEYVKEYFKLKAKASKDMFDNPEDAKKRGEELGLEGTHTHKDDSGKTRHMPGKSHEEYRKALKKKDQVIESPESDEDQGPSSARYKYEDPRTGEIFTFKRRGVYKKNGRVLVPVAGSKAHKGEDAKAVEYQGRKVTLNKPFRTPDGPKKTSVYVKNEKGNVVKVNFGDPDMEIKRDSPARKKSFRARHNCDNPGPKWKARYWSCKAWE